ncbi:MAG: serine/threonine-protein kinase [Trebonia sp.]
MAQETTIGTEPVDLPDLPGNLDAFPVFRITTDSNGNEKGRRIIRVEVRGAIASRTAYWRNALDALDARDRQWLLQKKTGTAKGITERLGQRSVRLLYEWCAAGIVTFQAEAVSLSGRTHGELFSWRLADPVHHLADQAADEKANQRATQGDEARRLAAELAPYPAAGPLVAILSAQRGGPYRDHAIEAARVLIADGPLPGKSEDMPWVAVRWLKRGKKADYAMSPEPIDEGGQGAVFRAVHKLTDITIALKRLRLNDDDSVHRMGREIDMGHQYGDHPNVMPVLDADPDGRWFIMPLANGSAADHADRLRETEALRDLIEAVCEGLRQPHADGWTHRDIKPANILLLQGRWVVADWGLGRRPRGQTSVPRRTRTGTGFGSEGFAAPELSSGNPHNVTAAADIYSIGRLIAAILTGEPPAQNLPLLPESGPWQALVAEATHHKPTDRPQDVDEFLRLLKSIS